MKHTRHGIKTRKHHHANGTHENGTQKNAPQTQKHNPPQPSQRQFTNNIRKPMLPRWLLIILCVGGAFGGTWAFAELVLWNKLPPELVGKWVVVEGPQVGATFDFSRSGRMVGKINIDGREGIINATVELDGKKMYWITESKNGQQDKKIKDIRTLTAKGMVIEDDRGMVLKMARVN